MNEESFFSRRKPDWLKLLELCDRANRSPTDLSKEQLVELFRLYRRTSADLAYARTVSTSPSLIQYLNDVNAKAYAVVYRQARQPFLQTILNIVVQGAETVRRRKAFVFASAGIFFGSALTVFVLCRISPTMHSLFAPAEMQPVFAQWKTGKFPERSGSESAAMWTFYASHNPTVSIVAGAVGAGSFGLLSLFMILSNGAIMGSLSAEMAGVNRLDFLLSSITPHGVPEISGLVFSGATGLLLGWSLINPGLYSRGESLRLAGRDAITLLATSVVMMFIAAPIEGFFSFNPHVPGFVKTTVAIVSFVLWMIFWSRFGKKVPPPDPFTTREGSRAP